MRLVALGICAAAAAALMATPVSAAPVQQPDRNANLGSSTPAAINDHDGAFIPSGTSDREFEFNPDGDDQALNNSPGADRDEDGNDEAIYQGEDDTLPA